MHLHGNPNRKTVLRFCLALTFAAACLAMGAGRTFASFTTCRTDPTVYLSNGAVVVMYADISDSLSDVQHVSYTLHVPAGVYATNITYDSTGYLESVTVVDDQSRWHGYSDTLVTTGASNIPVTAYSAIQGWVSGTVSGYSGQDLLLGY